MELFRQVHEKIEGKNILLQIFAQENPDIVIHLAAQAGVRYSIESPDMYIQSNIVGFFNILESCRHNNVSNLCFASSSSVYGLNGMYGSPLLKSKGCV